MTKPTNVASGSSRVESELIGWRWKVVALLAGTSSATLLTSRDNGVIQVSIWLIVVLAVAVVLSHVLADRIRSPIVEGLSFAVTAGLGIMVFRLVQGWLLR